MCLTGSPSSFTYLAIGMMRHVDMDTFQSVYVLKEELFRLQTLFSVILVVKFREIDTTLQ